MIKQVDNHKVFGDGLNIVEINDLVTVRADLSTLDYFKQTLLAESVTAVKHQRFVD